ncbi:uncharacterized protein N7503_004476 [Penicillium pulvis]|uniref:uncharacterized protein n=1 Tax=Penicillium pulvis TaxID=1562058 RepID=UPI002546C226|nr:uncharacterized protein N7503_004476 [Penicillium pulvis]KAJ5802026.1 hypothetical protein N7503_004476 [Penicillium pulvis]
MDRLPNEILEQICLYLQDPHYGSRRDLSSFSRVNRVCYTTAAPMIYRQLTLKFWDMESLQAAVSEVTESAGGRHFMRYARRLGILCLTAPLLRMAEEESSKWKLEPWATNLITYKEPATKNSFLEHYLYWCNQHPNMPILINRTNAIRRDRSWESIESLIVGLHRLEQLDFVTRNEFTSGLEQAVSRHHPNCRVDLTPHHNWANHEFSIDVLQLPGLHTLAVSLVRNESQSTASEGLDDMLPFLVTAPGLRHLILEDETNSHGIPLTRLREKWQSLLNARPATNFSRLESITFSAAGLCENILIKLAAIGNLSNLRSLHIRRVYDPINLVNIAKLFPNLKRLFIDPNPKGRPGMHLQSDHDDSIAAIIAFAPLNYLYIYGLRSAENLHRIVERHGSTLKGLIIAPSTIGLPRYPRFDVLGILQLAKLCPNLEELRLQIKRSTGSKEECELYKALGQFLNLHSLVLDLHFDARPRPPLFHIDTQDLTVLRKTLINAAMDEKLALGIWNMINTNGSSRLKYLRVVPFGAYNFSTPETYLLDCFAKSYLVTRYNFHNPGSPSIEEIGKRAREIRHHKRIYSEEETFRLPERLTLLLHDIWPEVPQGSDWWSCWSSFPLEQDPT